MKTRIAVWACMGFLAAGLWGLYFANADKGKPIGPLVDTLARLTQPVAAVIASCVHLPVGLHTFLWMNAATYALVGLLVETVRRQLNRPN
jgi:hypothetical protein